MFKKQKSHSQTLTVKKSMAVITSSSSSQPTSNTQNTTNPKTRKKQQKPKPKNVKKAKKDHNDPDPTPAPANPTRTNDHQPTQELSSSKSSKRSKAPGVRLIGARIYDSEHGKSCHQCRQKTMDFTVTCKSQRNNKQCTFNFCYKCLLNRYGENAEELAKLDDWVCPKCRDICNCSFCMKKKGFHPTGFLIRTAKANGFSSVSDMLCINKSVDSKIEGASSKKKASKSVSSKMETEVGPVRRDVNSSGLDDHSALKSQPNSLKNKAKNKNTQTAKTLRESDGTSYSSENNVERNESELAKDVVMDTTAANDMVFDEFGHHKETEEIQGEEKDSVVEISLPQGTELTSIADIKMAAEDFGLALQFLEFCEAFGKVLDLKKGQPELILRELACDERRSTRKDDSALVQFHIKLISLIQENSAEEYSLLKARNKTFWLEGLQQCIAESEDPTKESLLSFLDVDIDGYDHLSTSKKLKIVTFLCHEALSIPVLRSWIDEQNVEFVKEAKKAKEIVLPGQKEKEKDLKRKARNEMAKALIQSSGVPLSISEYNNLILKIKAETAQSLASTDEDIERPLKKTVSKEKLRSDAVRSEPLLLDASGRIFWKLRGYDGSSDILLQDIGNRDLDNCKERWFKFDDQEKEMVAKYISSFRKN